MPDPQQGQGQGGDLMRQAIDKILKTLKADEFLALTQGQPDEAGAAQRGQDLAEQQALDLEARGRHIRSWEQVSNPNWMENIMQQQGRFPRGGMGDEGPPLGPTAPMPTTDPWVATPPPGLAQQAMARQRAAGGVANEQFGAPQNGMPQGMDRARMMQAIQQMIGAGAKEPPFGIPTPQSPGWPSQPPTPGVTY